MNRRILIATGVAVAVSVVGSAAFAAWEATTSMGSANSKALAMPTGATPTSPATTSGSITLTWTAAQLAGADLTSYTVRRYPAAGGAGAVITCASQTITNHVVSCTYTETTAGSYQYTDTPLKSLWVGTESAKSGTTVVANADTTPPSVTITAVPTPTNNNKPAFGGGYGTAVGDIASVTVRVRQGTNTGTVVATPAATVNAVNSTWSTAALSTALGEGIFVVTATQSDAAGNSKTVESTFLVDTVKPVVSITSPANGATDIAHGTVTISGTAGRLTGDATSVTVEVTIGTDKTTVTGSVNQSTGAWSVQTGVGNNKTASVKVTQTDHAANSGSATSSFST